MIAVFGLALALAAPGNVPDRSHPPSLGPPRTLSLPAVHRLSLTNGLPVLLSELHELPVVEVVVVVRTGAAHDPRGQEGLAAMTAALLDEGAGGKDALTLADALDTLGAELTTSTTWDSSLVRLHVPLARLEPALALLADVVCRPNFPAAELERVRQETLTRLLQERDDPTALAAAAVARATFPPDHRYARPMDGGAASLGSLTVSGVQEFHAQHYRPGNAALVVVGDVTPDLVGALEKAFGGWAKGGATPPALPAPPQVKGHSLLLVNRPGAAQSAIRLARVGPPRATPDFPRLEVLNALFGGSFTSRLNTNLRETKGYSYGAFSHFRYRRVAGVLEAGADVETKVTAPAVSEILKEVRGLRQPIPADEVERARNLMALSYPADFETTRQIATQLANLVTFELPADAFTGFIARVLAVRGPEVEQAAARQIDPDNLALVVVGDASQIEAPLKALGWGRLRVLSVDELVGPAPVIRSPVKR